MTWQRKTAGFFHRKSKICCNKTNQLTKSPTMVKSRAKPRGVQRSNIKTPKKETHEYKKGRYEKMSEKNNKSSLNQFQRCLKIEKKNNKSSFRGALCSRGSAPAWRPGFKSFIIFQESNSSHLKPNSNAMEMEIAGA